MKRKYRILANLSLLLLCVGFFTRCDDYDVEGDSSFYDNITVKVSGTVDNVLRVNLFNQQQIALEVSDENVVFDMRAFIYQVEDTTVVEIDEAGNIHPLALGRSEVSMVFRANPKVATRFEVEIWKDPIYVEKISVPNLIEAKLGKMFDLGAVAVVVPANADNPKLAYELLTPDVISVDEKGIITPLAEGEGKVKISSTDGSEVSVICAVVVMTEILVADFQIPVGFNDRTIGKGQTLDLGSQIEVLPANADNKQLEYTVTSGTDVLSIDENGLVTTLSEGAAAILITTTDGTDISKEVKLNVDNNTLLDRLFWSVTTQTATDYGHVVDNATGAPEHLFDGEGKTFLSLVKPGKSISPIPQQSRDFIPSFTVDLKSQQTFNYFIWRHRQSHNSNFLRVYGVNIEGSNDGETFTPINGSEIIWIPNSAGYAGNKSASDNTLYSIDIPESSYRYVKVNLVMWSDIYKGEHPDYPGNGATNGSTMQVSEFGLGKK